MNGRVYDPGLGRFISADPFIDGWSTTQGYNRYSYVHNNPLRFLDPSGFRKKNPDERDESEGSSGGEHINPNGKPMEQMDVWGRRLTPSRYGYQGAGRTSYSSYATFGQPTTEADASGMFDILYSAGWEPPKGEIEPLLDDETIVLFAGAFGVIKMFKWTRVLATGRAGSAAGQVTEISFSLTARGSKYLNISTKLTARQMQANLESNGFKVLLHTAGKNGPTTVLGKGQMTYSIYNATSGGWSAEVAVAGQTMSKIRLAGP